LSWHDGGMHEFDYEEDVFGRPVITAARATAPLTDPLAGLHSLAREQLVFTALTRRERKMMRAARNLPMAQRRIVAHHLLVKRRERWDENQGYLVREAKRLRDQDIVDDENRRQERWNTHLAREAEIQAAARDKVAERKNKPLVPERSPESYHRENDARWAPDDDEMEV